jgi:hypothetical protein
MHCMAAASEVEFQPRSYPATNSKNKRNLSVLSASFALQPTGLMAGIEPAQAREVDSPRERKSLLSQMINSSTRIDN